jgi:hypothetical protein
LIAGRPQVTAAGGIGLIEAIRTPIPRDRCVCASAIAAVAALASTHRGHHAPSTAAWTALTLDHGDTRDLAFATGQFVRPVLLGTDGGRTAPRRRQHWTFTGGVSGYNAPGLLSERTVDRRHRPL